MDDCSNCEVGSKFDQLRRFIGSQPAQTAVGVAYIQNGQLRIVETPTFDRERATRALSVPEGGMPASPFRALTELIEEWPRGASRRAVLMISNGIDSAPPDAVRDPSADAAIRAAQKASVTVYAVYHPGADYQASDPSKVHSGQVHLAHVADETGGEAYFLGFGPLPSLAPFLADISGHLANQYLLEFVMPPGEGSGQLRQVTVKSDISVVELMTPYRAWAPGSGAGAAGAKSPQ